MSAHPTGLPAGTAAHTCGGCAWAGGDPLRCEMAAPEGAPGPRIEATTRACTHFEPPPDCADCGACCREAFDSVPVVDDDHRTRERQAAMVITHDDGWRDLRRVPSPTGHGTRCAALDGDGRTVPFRCRIYADRPMACSGLEVGSSACLFARRRVGLAPRPQPPPEPSPGPPE